MLSDRDETETLGVEKTSITDDNNTSFTSSDDGTGCNAFLEVLKSSMSSLLSPEVDEVINEVPSIEVDESDGDSIYNLIVNERGPPQTQVPAPLNRDYRSVRASVLERDTDNVANYISIKKIFDKNENNYYYSESNFKARKKYEKYFKRRRSKSHDLENLDESVHSKVSLVKHCISASIYQGPPPVKEDGSAVESIIKKRNTLTSQTRVSSSTQRSSGSSSGTRFKSNITFSNVDVREYERIAGDNPCVRGGVPLSIGWANIQHESIPLDEYENAKGPPRDKIEMIVPASVRRSMLRDEFKVSVPDLNAAMKSVNICKKQRANTLASEHLEVFQEVIEVAKRKFKRMVGKAVSTRKQAEELWQASHDAAMAEYLEENEGASLQMRNGIDNGDDELLGLDIGSIIVCDGEENESDKKLPDPDAVSSLTSDRRSLRRKSFSNVSDPFH